MVGTGGGMWVEEENKVSTYISDSNLGHDHRCSEQFSAELMAKRIIKDWEELPKQMRKSCTEKDVSMYFKLVTGFCFMLRLFQAEVCMGGDKQRRT